MSNRTKTEVLEKMRRRYVTAGLEHKTKLINEAVTLFGYHRKAAIRALGADPRQRLPLGTGGRPREYESRKLLPVLRAIWEAASCPCGKRLQMMMPDWLAGYEEHERGVPQGVREQLTQASARTLDRLLEPVRMSSTRQSLTRPGSLLRHQIPIRGAFWEEGKAGWLEVDTVALCGGSVAGDFIWMLDGVDYQTAWVTVRAMWNRGQEGTLRALKDLEQSLPFALLGLDSDNGGEFLNHHVVRWLQHRSSPVCMTRSRPYKKDDNAHVEQKNWTHVRKWFGYERYDNAEVLEPMNELVRGPYAQLLNYFHASMKLESKDRDDKSGKIRRVYGKPQTPLSRVLQSTEVREETKRGLRREKNGINPFALKAEVDRRLKEIEKIRARKKE